MNLFNLFNRKTEAAQAPQQITPVFETEKETANEVETSQDETTSSTKAPLTVSYATGWPIDIIYGYLHKNFENKGYEDAMLNSNLTFRDMNMAIIRNKVLMIFREVNLKYDGMKREIETRIDTCNAAGLLSSSAELEKQMAIINAHKSELAQLESDFRNNANEASVPLMSYECGFLRGVSAIAMSAPTQSQSQASVTMPSTPFFTANRVTA